MASQAPHERGPSNDRERGARERDRATRGAHPGGWRILDAAGRPAALSQGNAVEWLIDGEAFFGATLHAIQRANRRIHVMQLLLKRELAGAFHGTRSTAESKRRKARDGEDDPVVNSVNAGVNAIDIDVNIDDAEALRPVGILDALVDATRRGVEVRILLNENAVVPDDVDEVRELFAGGGGGGVAGQGRAIVRGFPLSPEVLHAKLTLIDDEEAIIVGPPGEPRWWDTRRHFAYDARRGKGQPMHDAGVRVRGPMVAPMTAFFASLWNARDGAERGPRDRLDPIDPPSPTGRTTLFEARTMPVGLGGPAGETGILDAYRRALERADRFVFLETQYFTSPVIARALSEALSANHSLQAILVVNNNMDVPFRHYDRLQSKRLRELGWPDHPRLGVFSLVATDASARETSEGKRSRPGAAKATAVEGAAGAAKARSRAELRSVSPRSAPDALVARDVYVHTKACVVDDCWATLGSANLDGYSLDEADEFGLAGVRSIEYNLCVLDGIEDAPDSGAARALRVELWGEELGLPQAGLLHEPPEGWLHVWTRAAHANLEALARGEAPRGFALPHQAALPPGVAKPRADFNFFNMR